MSSTKALLGSCQLLTIVICHRLWNEVADVIVSYHHQDSFSSCIVNYQQIGMCYPSQILCVRWRLLWNPCQEPLSITNEEEVGTNKKYSIDCGCFNSHGIYHYRTLYIVYTSINTPMDFKNPFIILKNADKWIFIGDKWIFIGDKWIFIGDKWIFIGDKWIFIPSGIAISRIFSHLPKPLD